MAGAQQLSLLNESPVAVGVPAIAGLSYIPNYIDSTTEAALIHIIDTQPWMTELKRRVQHYGYRYDYKARNMTSESRLGDIPKWLMPLCQKLSDSGLFREFPDQIIINEYVPGQGIASHIDCIPCFCDTIASLSLGSSCVMDFTHSNKHEKSSLLLKPCSLLVLSGHARYEWQHGIAHRKTDPCQGSIIERTRRISLTFRKVILDFPTQNPSASD